MTDAGAPPAAARPPRAQMLTAWLAIGALLLLLVNAILLWQLLDETQSEDSGSGQSDLPAELPPPSGSGKALARSLDRSFNRITGPLGQLTGELESANLRSVPPLLEDLNRNTQTLPQFEGLLRELTGPGGPLRGLQAQLGDLSGQLLPLETVADLLPPLNSGVGRLDRSLGDSTDALDETGGSLRETNVVIREMLPLLRDLAVAVREAKASLDRTNQCLEQPVVCQAEEP